MKSSLEQGPLLTISADSWGPQTYDKLRDWVPEGSSTLQKAWVKDYLPAVQWMRDNGVPIAKRFDGIMTIGAVRQMLKVSRHID